MENFHVPSEIQKWLSEFGAIMAVEGFSPTTAVDYLIQLGVNDPHMSKDLYTPLLGWIYQNQRFYNKRVWEMLAHKTRHQMRLVLQRDLQSDGEIEGYGKIVLKEYAQGLLKHFLVAKPTWC